MAAVSLPLFYFRRGIFDQVPGPLRPGGTFTFARWQSHPSLSCLESTLGKMHQNTVLTPFRINTCKSVSKQSTLTAFRINTYEKHRGRGVLWLTRHPTKVVCPRLPSKARSIPLSANFVQRATLHPPTAPRTGIPSVPPFPQLPLPCICANSPSKSFRPH